MEAARTAAVRERELQIRAILSSRSDLVKELFEREIAPLSPVTSSDQRRMFNEFADGFRIRAPNQPSDPAPLSNAGPLATAQVLPIQNGVDSTADRVDSMAAPPLPTEQTRKRARLMPSTPKRASKATLKMDLTQTTALRYRALPSKPQRREERYQLIEWHLKVQNPKLSELLSAGNKVVMTKDWQLAREEAKQVKMIKRIEEMKANNVWSFRQLKRQPEPRIAPSRHDFMMEEMRLMREDFRQERKWKMAQAYTLAGWVLEWHNAENKASLCVTRLRKALPATRNETEALSDEKAKLEDSEWSLDHIIRDEALQPANDGSQLETAEVPHEEAMKREVEVLSARTAIDLDVDFQSSVYFYEDSDSGLFGSASSIYGVYGLPSVSEAEAERPTEYFDQVVPVSKFMANRWFSPGAFGNSKADYEGPVENEGVRTDVISRKQSIFGGDGESNVMDDEIPPPQSATPVQDSISRSPWSIDEDDALLMLGTESSHNWGLISESLSAMHLGPGEKRGEWECYNRYKTLVALRGDKGSEISKSSKFRTRTVTKQDMGRRMARMLSTFEFIQRKARQRPERLNRKDQTALPKKVSLSAHETHRQSQESAGITVGGEPLAPTDVGQIKEQRDRQLILQQQSKLMSQRSMTQIRPMGMPTSSQMPISMPYSQGQRPIFRPGMGVNSSPLVIQGLHQGGHQIRPPQPTVPRITPTNITPEQLQHIQTLVQKKLALQNLAALFPNDPNVLANLRNVQQMLAPLGPVLQAYGGMARPAQMQVGGQYFQSDAHAAAAMVAIQNGQRQLMAENADRQRQLAMQQQQQQLSAALGPSANMGANLTTGGGAVMSAIPGFGLQQSLSGNGSFPGTSASFPVLGTGEVAGASELAADVAVDKAGKAAMPPGPVVSGTSSAPLPAPPPPPPSSTASPSPTPSKRKKK